MKKQCNWWWLNQNSQSGDVPVLISDNPTSSTVDLYWSDVGSGSYKVYSGLPQFLEADMTWYHIAYDYMSKVDYDIFVTPEISPLTFFQNFRRNFVISIVRTNIIPSIIFINIFAL